MRAVADLPFTLDQLRILRAIVSEGSFKKAADSLYVTQPAVSLQIQNLEKQLEVSLFGKARWSQHWSDFIIIICHFSFCLLFIV